MTTDTPEGGKKIRVLIVDDHRVVRVGLRAIIDAEPDMQVVAEAGDGPAALAAYAEHKPDITLLDLRMPGMSGPEVLTALRKADPERMVAVLMTLFRCVRDLAIAVRAVVPTSSDKLLDQMGIASGERDFLALSNDDWFVTLVESGFRILQPVGVFPRLEMPEGAA